MVDACRTQHYIWDAWSSTEEVKATHYDCITRHGGGTLFIFALCDVPVMALCKAGGNKALTN